MPQMNRQMLLPLEGRGEAPRVERSVEALPAPTETESSGLRGVMTAAVSRPNMFAALKRVRKNKGSPGVDGMTVDELPDWLREHWPRIREQLLSGAYVPQAVKRVLIPKAGGGERMLGIPTVLDRLIQQALLQILQPAIDPTFSTHSYGFRPGRRAHDAVCHAQKYVQAGRKWVVDVDLARFFDRVNHDVLMGRLAKRVADKRALQLIRRYLSAGILADGVVVERHQGTPQGGPLSPLLANVLLDEVDQALEARGHAFVRYADDCNVYVRSKRAGERVMGGLRRLFGRLRLEINESKSAVARVWKRQFLGFSFWTARGRVVKPRVSDKAMHRFKSQIRGMTRRICGQSLEVVVAQLRRYMLGWRGYFRLAATPRRFQELDKWIRHRLRAIQLKQWKRGRTAYKALRALGMKETIASLIAFYCRNWWRTSARDLHRALPNRMFDEMGLPRLAG